MSFCYNPACTKPENPNDAKVCQACGTKILLKDRYRCARVLGRGGFGTTFLADDMVLPGQPNCVIKQLRPAVTAPHVIEMARQLFQREATTLGKIGNHPQVPRLLDYFEQGAEFYLVQEYVGGLTLQQEVKRNGAMSEAQVQEVLREVLPILDYLHKIEVIHRDIKPANLIRREIDGKLILIDFGAVKDKVSQAMLANPQDYSAFTAFAVGTPGYAPPEQMAMRPVYSSDLYALGVTCIYLLTGKSPKDLGYDNTTGEFIWRTRVTISPDFQKVLEKLMEVSVKHRYQTAQDVLLDLDRVQQRAEYQQQIASSQPEPYGDLSQGLASTPVSRIDPSSGRTGSNSPQTRNNPRTAVSPSTRYAANAVRAQQARADLQPNYTRVTPPAIRPPQQRPSTPAISPLGAGQPVSREATPQGNRLTAQALVAAYTRGQRDFTEHRLDNLVLRKVNLSGARFVQASLQKTDFRNSVMNDADFGRASLGGANLKDCNLMGAYFVNADLQGANLQGANLREATLTNANLRGANLHNADLTGSNISPDQLSQARTNWFTIHPNGKRGIGI